ncbi:diphthamide synthesis protein [Candidatus Pacearchaeota archaeon]|nr:diphthamide synthesis protein [Candidatus Pacearchaeota archaeon]
MKTVFIPAYAKTKFDEEKFLSEIKNSKLPKNISLAYSIQYKQLALQIKEFLLEKKYNPVSFTQVLGCSSLKSLKSQKNTKAILLIGSGLFHAASLAYETKLLVYLYSANSGTIKKISDEEILKLEKTKKSSYINYLNSDKIGVLISLKPGQRRFEQAINFKKILKNKNSYLFIGDNLNTQETENFPQIQAWVNTACPRLDFEYKENKIINLKDLVNKNKK